MSQILPIVFLLTSYLFSINGLSKCGIRANSYYIVGGQSTKPLSWPWMGLLKIKSREIQNNRIHTYICGATLINDRWILTAAHCLREPVGQKFDLISVGLGKHNFSFGENFDLQAIRVRNFHLIYTFDKNLDFFHQIVYKT